MLLLAYVWHMSLTSAECWCRWSHRHASNPALDLPVFLLSLPQSQARRTAIEPRIRMHASNLTLVQPYDGRRPRMERIEVAAPALACFMLLP